MVWNRAASDVIRCAHPFGVALRALLRFATLLREGSVSGEDSGLILSGLCALCGKAAFESRLPCAFDTLVLGQQVAGQVGEFGDAADD